MRRESDAQAPPLELSHESQTVTIQSAVLANAAPPPLRYGHIRPRFQAAGSPQISSSRCARPQPNL